MHSRMFGIALICGAHTHTKYSLKSKKKINKKWINRITHLIDRSICCVNSLHGLHCIRRLNTNGMNHMISKNKITTKFDNAIDMLMIRSASSCIIAWIFYDRQLCARSTNTNCKCVYVIIWIALFCFRYSIFRLHTTAAVLSSLNKFKTLNVFDEMYLINFFVTTMAFNQITGLFFKIYIFTILFFIYLLKPIRFVWCTLRENNLSGGKPLQDPLRRYNFLYGKCLCCWINYL